MTGAEELTPEQKIEMLSALYGKDDGPTKPTITKHMENKPDEIKLTLWKKTGKKADGTEFTSFSTSSPLLTGVDSWINGYARVANTREGAVDVIDLVIKPKQPRPGSSAPVRSEEPPF